MWNRKEIKAKGKSAFKANYWNSVLVALIVTVISGGVSLFTANGDITSVQSFRELLEALPDTFKISTISFSVSFVIELLIFNPLEVGCQKFFIENSKEPSRINPVISGFTGNYANAVGAILLRNIFTFLWSLLFIIPGIVKSYSYRMVPYIMADNPETKPTEAINISRRMMKGNKWKAFVLDLSFVGWIILSILTLGILLVFYVDPYILATNAELYNSLKEAPAVQE